MLKRLLLLAVFALAARAQDCPVVQFLFNGGNGTAQFDNRSAGCNSWTVYYQADSGLSAYTLAFQSTTGTSLPGTWVAYAGNTSNSSASFGTAALGLATFCGLANCVTSGVTVNTPWVRVDVAGATGSGTIRGAFYGYKTGASGGPGGGGGGGTGCPNPCPVEGTAAPGSAASNPVPTGVRDDSQNVLADHSFPGQAQLSFSSATAARILTGVSGKQIYVGHLSLSWNNSATFEIVEGTTTSTPCDTSSTVIAGPYAATITIALDFTRDDPLTVAAGDDLCVNLNTSATGGGLMKYSQR